MASYFERKGRLSTSTMQAWDRFHSGHSTFEDRLLFYVRYFQDVVPCDVVVCHVPAYTQTFDLMPDGYPLFRREEIQLRCMEGILMTGLVSMEWYPQSISSVAATVAFEQWRYGLVVPDQHQTWGMFTCRHEIQFYVSRNGRDYRGVSCLSPLDGVDEVVNYIRSEYERIRRD